MLGPAGRLKCRFDGLGEGYRIEVWVLAPTVFADRYAVWIEHDGDKKSERLLRGEKEASYAEGPSLAPTWVRVDLGEISTDGLAVKIVLAEAGVSWRTRLPMRKLHRYRISALVVGTSGIPSYSVEDGRIVSRTARIELDYFAALHAYPLAWRSEVGGARYGRYLADHLTRRRDRLSTYAAISISSPTNRFCLGLAYEVVPGIAVSMAWMPSRASQLAGGYSVGQTVAGDTAPTTSRWELRRVALGFSVDSALVARAVAFFN
ncbi:MAG: hypothetical protein M3680_04600 [Myxococcota bacterium]|nr:hypothetical protein [Myxococcota bacterium]